MFYITIEPETKRSLRSKRKPLQVLPYSATVLGGWLVPDYENDDVESDIVHVGVIADVGRATYYNYGKHWTYGLYISSYGWTILAFRFIETMPKNARLAMPMNGTIDPLVINRYVNVNGQLRRVKTQMPSIVTIVPAQLSSLI